MKLQIDAGNTRVKWRTDTGSTSATNSALWGEVEDAGLFVELSVTDVSEVLVSCVAASEKRDRLSALIASHLPGVPVTWFESVQGLGGITYAYHNMSKLGIDRIMVMVAAKQIIRGPFMVLDCGSAITADLVDRHAVHLGGYIFPGISLLKASLAQGTGNVAVSEEGFGDLSPGRDTEECVEHAINLMLVSTIQTLLDRAKKQGVEAVLITGGDAQRIISLVGFPFDYRPDLVLDGVLHIHSKG